MVVVQSPLLKGRLLSDCDRVLTNTPSYERSKYCITACDHYQEGYVQTLRYLKVLTFKGVAMT